MFRNPRSRAMFDLTDERVGTLTVLHRDATDGRFWICRCDCGTETRALTNKLRAFSIKSCGRSTCTLRRAQVGDVFGRLTIVGDAPRFRNGARRWRCRCECGNETESSDSEMRIGRVRSCGCFRRQRVRELMTTHGRSGGPTYKCWSSIIQRCTNPKNPSFSYYGGRGIRICERWRNDFALFIADMGPKPTPKHSIDRIDVNGNYEPGNCRWATATQQARNTRVSKLEAHEPAQIRWLVADGYSKASVSRFFSVSTSLVNSICKGHSWCEEVLP
jgi:hypothetical protein